MNLEFERKFGNPEQVKEVESPSVLRNDIRAILEKQGEVGKNVWESTKGITSEEMNRLLSQAIDFITDPDRLDQFHLGGAFVAEGGQDRGRRIVSLDHPDLIKEYPFLKYLALKIVPTKARGPEVNIHRDIQEAVEHDPGVRFTVPRILNEISLENLPGKTGVVIERLLKTEKSNTLQSLIENAKRQGIVLRLSDDAGMTIHGAYNDLHELGFVHGDINEGNIYLQDIQYMDFKLPKEHGKVRPSKLRLIMSASAVLLDFERTKKLSEAVEGAVNVENKELNDFLSEFAMAIDRESDVEEVIEANDDYWQERHAA